MSATVKLSSAMPGDPEVNGVDHIAAVLVEAAEADNPTRAAIVWYDAAKVTIDADSGTHVPTIRIRRIEDLGLLADVPADVQALATRAGERRSGRTPLPFDEIEVIGGDQLAEDGGE